MDKKIKGEDGNVYHVIEGKKGIHVMIQLPKAKGWKKGVFYPIKTEKDRISAKLNISAYLILKRAVEGIS